MHVQRVRPKSYGDGFASRFARPLNERVQKHLMPPMDTVKVANDDDGFTEIVRNLAKFTPALHAHSYTDYLNALQLITKFSANTRAPLRGGKYNHRTILIVSHRQQSNKVPRLRVACDRVFLIPHRVGLVPRSEEHTSEL